MAAVLLLSEVDATDVEKVGGKGANLGELVRAGFPVPTGFVVTVETYHDAIVTAQSQASPADFVRLLEEYEFPPGVRGRIADAHAALQAERPQPVRYAVRSSATAEDLGDASFAGQHETFYGIGIDALESAIKRCWTSLWSDQAVTYRETQGIGHADVAMAVVVQEMIASGVSGVTFTANPLTGAGDEVVSDAVWGMGSAIVDGRVSADHFVVARETREVVVSRVVTKTQMVRPESGDTTTLSDVPEDQRRLACLDDEQLQEVTRWALKSEAHFGKPQDLEWALADGRYYMLQSRPITTLIEENDEMPGQKLVIYKPVAENFTDPLLPLSVDIMSQLVPTVMMYRGRVYQPIDAARLALPLHLTDDQAAELLYWEVPEDLEIRIRWLMVPVSLLVAGVYYLLTGLHQARSRAMPDGFLEGHRDLFAEVDRDPKLSPAGAMGKMLIGPGAFAPVGRSIIFINVTAVLRYFVLMGVLNKLLARWIPGLQRDAGSLLCSGSNGVLSTEMGRSVTHLASIARRTPDVAFILQTYARGEVMAALAATTSGAEFLDAFKKFLAIHGHRALKEFELASPRFEEDPTPVLAMIRNYLQTETDPEEMALATTDRRIALADEIREMLSGRWLENVLGWRWRIIEYLADRTRYFVKLRENSRFYHIMAWNAARRKVLRAEKRLLDSGKLKVRGDIFYLLWAEVEALGSGSFSWSDVEERIRARRMRHVRWSKQTPPKTLNINSTRVARVPDADGSLTGQGASPGVYEGVARVILDPRVDAELNPGEILVAPFTDPAWTPLFLVARAAVVGVGSYLSHAGTIAREYGMPCVVDVTDCTSLIRTGDRLRVDGTEGTVQFLNREPGA